MKKINVFMGFVLMLLFIGQGVFAQNGCISAKDLAKSKDAIIISARNKADFKKVHIKGAVNIDIHDLQSKTPYDGKLKSTKSIAEIFGSRGIKKDSKVVLYCKSGVNAGRVYWVMKYLGVKDVKILAGQMAGWRAARKPVTKAATPIKKATFTPTVNSKIIANKSYVKSKIGNAKTVIIDVRKKEEYAKAHIDKAVNIPYLSLQNKNNLKSKAAMEAIFKAAGASSDKEIILYCNTGITTGIAFFVLKEILKYPNVKVYEGSYNEWKM